MLLIGNTYRVEFAFVQNVDLGVEPWRPPKKPKPAVENAQVTNFKGTQFLMPAKAFYCFLCRVFVGSVTHADDHLKSNNHNRAFVVRIALPTHSA